MLLENYHFAAKWGMLEDNLCFGEFSRSKYWGRIPEITKNDDGFSYVFTHDKHYKLAIMYDLEFNQLREVKNGPIYKNYYPYCAFPHIMVKERSIEETSPEKATKAHINAYAPNHLFDKEYIRKMYDNIPYMAEIINKICEHTPKLTRINVEGLEERFYIIKGEAREKDEVHDSFMKLPKVIASAFPICNDGETIAITSRVKGCNLDHKGSKRLVITTIILTRV